MADNRYPKNKSTRRIGSGDLKSSSRKRRHEEHKETKRRSDCKTPPLPSKVSSLDELIKQRQNLKEELKRISKNKLEENTMHDSITNSFKSNGNHPDANDNHNAKKNRKTIKPLPEQEEDYTHLDSEDEENIIEQRRRQRKQLLEKLNLQSETENVCLNKTAEPEEIVQIKTPCEESPSPDKPSSAKETTDMFSEKDFVPNKVPDSVTQDNSNSQLSDNWDDPEGYYNVRIGDIIDNNKYVVKSILGQGVFANVILAQDIKNNKSEVAIKIMRNNDLMYKTGLKELAMLRKINDADPENKYHCVRLLKNFMHKGHLCLVFEPLYMDLRHVIKKYGRHRGLNMKAVMSYSRQLLLALRHLKKVGIIHADVKPDNILVNEKKNILKLCDFGSAMIVGYNESTPYLVSRFYRAPEIILGIPFKHSVDVWSAACTIYEMTTGKIMFTGSSNNKMLKCFMDLKGKIPGKMIQKGKFKDQHFNYNNNFLLHKKDEATGREKFVELFTINVSRDLLQELKKTHKSAYADDEKKLIQLKDFLDKMLGLDYHQRMTVTDCLNHPFIQEPLVT
ncbi:serine/threonine-protein kinase PRP4 homolog [Ostrinia nubilalis]|uniref:serine/threonine-protein kinase PRP4 homolog n=1 Tax=Ostrinia nubilalis TaxID=29057 RepID=UPI00308248DC